MGDPVQNDSGLYQTPHCAVFHVEPMPVGQARQRRIGRVKRGDEELRGQAHDLPEQALEVARIELRGWVIHK